jgi:hypothetical protein
MTEENKTRDAFDAVTGLAKAVPIYQDVLQPAAQEIGKGLQTVAKTVHIALAPISVLVWGYDQIKDFINTKVSQKLENIPPQNIISPKPSIAVPTIEALRYTGNEPLLSDLYASLLASSMNIETTKNAHPSFVETIKQLTSDEAKILHHLKQSSDILGIVSVYKVLSNRTPFFGGSMEGGELILEHYSHIGINAECEYPELSQIYLNNLCRLGLCQIDLHGYLLDKSKLDELNNDPHVLNHIRQAQTENTKENVEYYYLRLTTMGNLFIDACISNDNKKTLSGELLNEKGTVQLQSLC